MSDDENTTDHKNDLGQIVADNIQRHMERRALNGVKLAEKAGLSRTSVYAVVQRKAKHPRLDTLMSIAAAMDLTILDLLDDGSSDAALKQVEALVSSLNQDRQSLTKKLLMCLASDSQPPNDDSKTGGDSTEVTRSENIRLFEDIADRIKWHRSTLGLNQAEYSDSIAVTRSEFSLWEAGTHRISLDGALKMNRRYGVSLDFLYLGADGALSMTLRNAWLERKNAEQKRLTKPPKA